MKLRVHADISDNSAELDVLADAVVRGCTICYARIKSLRALIEAIQRHPKAQLDPSRVQQSQDKEHSIPSWPNTLTVLKVYRGAILEAECTEMDIWISLDISAHFLKPVNFERAHFSGDASFNSARFSGDSRFLGARFSGRTDFSDAHFSGDASFMGTHFSHGARFIGACFSSNSDFWGAHFSRDANFIDACFSRDAKFSGARFSEHANFQNACFSGGAWFRGACFSGDVFGDMRPCELATASFGQKARREIRAAGHREGIQDKTPTTFRKLWLQWLDRLAADPDSEILFWPYHWITREFGWKYIRALGELQILSRVSLAALIGVPVLATLTGVLQAQFEEWPALGNTAALLYFASVFVTLGLLVYQVFAPDEVRKHDEDEFVGLAHQRYPEHAPDRDDGLRRAIEYLEGIARKRTDRHPNFVSHHGDTIWIPERGRVDLFRDWQPEKPEKRDSVSDEDNPADAESVATGANAVPGTTKHGVNRVVEPDEEDYTKSPTGFRTAIVPGAERARIAIEDGAKAEYWLKSRERIEWAWSSFLFYGIGIVCLLAILFIQAYHVGQAADWW